MTTIILTLYIYPFEGSAHLCRWISMIHGVSCTVDTHLRIVMMEVRRHSKTKKQGMRDRIHPKARRLRVLMAAFSPQMRFYPGNLSLCFLTPRKRDITRWVCKSSGRSALGGGHTTRVRGPMMFWYLTPIYCGMRKCQLLDWWRGIGYSSSPIARTWSTLSCPRSMTGALRDADMEQEDDDVAKPAAMFPILSPLLP